MRILLSAYACEPNRGSEPGFGWNWATHLARRGHHVEVLTTSRGRSAIEAEVAKGSHGGARFCFVDVPSPFERRLSGQIGVFAHYLIWQRIAAREAKRLAPADVVHHATWGSLQGGSFLWKLGHPFVFGPVGGGQIAPPELRSFVGESWTHERVRSILTRFVVPYSWSTRRLMRACSTVLCTNQETVRLAERCGAQRTALCLDTGLPDNYVLSEPPTRPRRGPLRLLWVARLLPRKGIRLALEAVRRCSVAVRLTIVGGGPLEGSVARWVEELGLEGVVERWGQVSWAKVREAYMSHDGFVFTSLRDSFGAQLLEAMAHGLPIITLDHHGARDFVPKDAAFKVPVSDAQSTVAGLAQAIERLDRQGEAAAEMGRIGLRFARGQTWSKKTDHMLQEYRRAVVERS